MRGLLVWESGRLDVLKDVDACEWYIVDAKGPYEARESAYFHVAGVAHKMPYGEDADRGIVVFTQSTWEEYREGRLAVSLLSASKSGGVSHE